MAYFRASLSKMFVAAFMVAMLLFCAPVAATTQEKTVPLQGIGRKALRKLLTDAASTRGSHTNPSYAATDPSYTGGGLHHPYRYPGSTRGVYRPTPHTGGGLHHPYTYPGSTRGVYRPRPHTGGGFHLHTYPGSTGGSYRPRPHTGGGIPTYTDPGSTGGSYRPTP